MTKDSTEGPRLSNFLTVLAVEVAGELAAYKRSSTAAHRAYLAAGAKLLDARAAAKRGEWAPFLTACGDDLDERTAQRMMQLARSGLTPDDVTAAGGVRGALESLAQRRNPSPVTAIEAPEPAEPHSHAHASPVMGGDERPAAVLAPETRTTGTTEGPKSDPAPAPVLAPMTLYQWRRARGECTSCGAPADGAVRCPGCVERVSAQRAKRRELAAIGDVLAPRIEAAVKAGEGIQLDAAEVAALASPPLRKRKARR